MNAKLFKNLGLMKFGRRFGRVLLLCSLDSPFTSLRLSLALLDSSLVSSSLLNRLLKLLNSLAIAEFVELRLLSFRYDWSVRAKLPLLPAEDFKSNETFEGPRILID